MTALDCSKDLAKASFYCAQDHLLQMYFSDEDGISSNEALRFISCVWEFFGFSASCMALEQEHEFPAEVKSLLDMYSWNFTPYEPFDEEDLRTFMEDIDGVTELRDFVLANGVGGHNIEDFIEILQLCKIYGRRLLGFDLQLDEEFCDDD